MENNYFDREIALIGIEAFNRLKNASVLIFGVGGVGGYALEALVRAGIGSITAVDSDCVSDTNINRQILATRDTVGMKKVDAAKARALSINPDISFSAIDMFYLPENANELDFSGYDYIIDAIDTVSAKINIAERAGKLGIPLISCMGTANRKSGAGFSICDVYETSGCPLARVMRRECKKRGIEGFKVVFSASESEKTTVKDENGRNVPASISYVPPIGGLLAAEEVIRHIAKI